MDFKDNKIMDFKLIKSKLRKFLQTFCVCGLYCNLSRNVQISLFFTQQSFKTLTQYKSVQFGGNFLFWGVGWGSVLRELLRTIE